MLPTEFQGSLQFGLKKNFILFFSIYGRDGHLGRVTNIISIIYIVMPTISEKTRVSILKYM